MRRTPDKADDPGSKLDEWSKHGEFVRRLARRLVGDEHVAEDLAQDVQLAALTSSRTITSTREHRAWLARVLRNLSINWRRGEKRRFEHERASASASPAEVGTSIELQQCMLAQVGKLAEPYRTTIYLRFYEQLKPQQIAEKQRVSVHTVKTRLQRGLQHLRQAMDREAGPRSDWRAVLVLPLCRPNFISPTTGAAVLGGAALKSKLVVTAVAIVLAAISLMLALQERPQPHAASKDPEPVAELEALPPTADRDSLQTPDRAAVESESKAPTRTGDWILSGRVFETNGKPIAGARVTAYVRPSPERVETVTDSEGRYRASLDIPDGVSHWAELSIHATAVARNHRPDTKNLYGLRAATTDEHELSLDFELARGASISGRILAADSTPERSLTATRTKVALVTTNGQKHASTRIDPEGCFAFPLPEVPRVWLIAGRGRFGSLVVGPLDLTPGEDLDLGDLVLDGPSTLRGRVTDPDGRPVPHLPIHARIDGDHVTNGIDLGRWHEDPEATTAIPPTVAGATNGSSMTDSDGRFSFLGLTPGTYELYVNSLDRESKDGPYRQSAGTFQTGAFAAVTVDGVYRARLTVVDANGLAVPSAQVSVSKKGAGGMQSLSSGLDASSVLDVEPGDYVASATVDGARPATHSFVVEKGIYSYEIRLVLDFAPTTGDIDLNVVDETGTRLRAFEVNFWDQDRDVLAPLITGKAPDHDGILRGIPVGRYRLRVRFRMEHAPNPESLRSRTLGDHFPVDALATVEAGRLTEVMVRAKTGGRILLSITGGEGEPVPVAIEIDDGQGGVRRLLYLNTKSDEAAIPGLGGPRTGAEGYTDLIRPGFYTLRARAEGFAEFETPVRIIGGETTRAQVTLRR